MSHSQHDQALSAFLEAMRRRHAAFDAYMASSIFDPRAAALHAAYYAALDACNRARDALALSQLQRRQMELPL
jgi:hypothetical protein